MNYNELEVYIKRLFNQYFNKYNLSVEDKQDVIQNSMMKIFMKVEDGTLIGNVEDNKNYIFITTRNFVYHAGNNKKKYDLPVDDIDVVSQDKNILDLMEFQHQKDIILNLLENNSFNQLERDLVKDVLDGNYPSEMQSKYNMTGVELNNRYSNAKLKLKHKLYHQKEPKYKIIYPNKEVLCSTLKELLKHIKVSPDTWKNYKRLGKLNFPKYKIEIL